MNKNTHTYTPIFVIPDGESNEIHFSLRDDGFYVISRCQILKGGERVFMRSSVMVNKGVLGDFADGLNQFLKTAE